MSDGARSFAQPGTSSVHNIANVDPGLASPAEPLQIESAKLHAPPGTLPPDPTDLLRPFAPAVEAAGDAQQLPPQVLTSRGVGGRPKGATKCDKCTQNKRRCGPDCPNWPGVQPIAQTAAPAQLPALAAAAMPLQSAPVATEGSSAEPRPLPAAAATAAPTDGAQDTATATELAPAQTPPPLPVAAAPATPIGAAAAAGSAAAQLEPQRRASSRSNYNLLTNLLTTGSGEGRAHRLRRQASEHADPGQVHRRLRLPVRAA